MSEETKQDEGVKPDDSKETASDDPLSALSPEAQKIFKETNAGLLTALQKERDANKEATARMATIEKENQERLEKQLQEQGKYKELAEERAKALAEALPKAEQLEAYEATLKEFLQAQIEEIPEEKRSLIPTMLPVKEQLAWLAVNRTLLMKTTAPKIGAGTQGGSESKGVDLTDEERAYARKFKMTDEDYAKYKNPND